MNAKRGETRLAEPREIEREKHVILPLPIAPKKIQVRSEPVNLAQITPAPALKRASPSAEPSVPQNRQALPVVVVAALPNPASSAGSSCLAAARQTDRLMCGDRNLASLDRQLKILYRQSYSEADESKRAALVGTRQRFNDRRDTCETSNCLTTAYVLRLKRSATSWLDGSSPRNAISWEG